MLYCGVDPGKAGAVAFIHDDGTFIAASLVPTIGKDYDLPAMVEILAERGDLRAAGLEHVHAMPGQGVTSMFSFGRGLGLWEGALAALRVPYELVRPKAWQKIVGALPADKDERKAAIVRAAKARWPEAPLERKKDWGVADALWLAEHCRRNDMGAWNG